MSYSIGKPMERRFEKVKKKKKKESAPPTPGPAQKLVQGP